MEASLIRRKAIGVNCIIVTFDPRRNVTIVPITTRSFLNQTAAQRAGLGDRFWAHFVANLTLFMH